MLLQIGAPLIIRLLFAYCTAKIPLLSKPESTDFSAISVRFPFWLSRLSENGQTIDKYIDYLYLALAIKRLTRMFLVCVVVISPWSESKGLAEFHPHTESREVLVVKSVRVCDFSE